MAVAPALTAVVEFSFLVSRSKSPHVIYESNTWCCTVLHWTLDSVIATSYIVKLFIFTLFCNDFVTAHQYVQICKFCISCHRSTHVSVCSCVCLFFSCWDYVKIRKDGITGFSPTDSQTFLFLG